MGRTQTPRQSRHVCSPLGSSRVIGGHCGGFGPKGVWLRRDVASARRTASATAAGLTGWGTNSSVPSRYRAFSARPTKTTCTPSPLCRSIRASAMPFSLPGPKSSRVTSTRAREPVSIASSALSGSAKPATSYPAARTVDISMCCVSGTWWTTTTGAGIKITSFNRLHGCEPQSIAGAIIFQPSIVRHNSSFDPLELTNGRSGLDASLAQQHWHATWPRGIDAMPVAIAYVASLTRLRCSGSEQSYPVFVRVRPLSTRRRYRRTQDRPSVNMRPPSMPFLRRRLEVRRQMRCTIGVKSAKSPVPPLFGGGGGETV
jgi:hypothetical protein